MVTLWISCSYYLIVTITIKDGFSYLQWSDLKVEMKRNNERRSKKVLLKYNNAAQRKTYWEFCQSH